MHDYPTPEQRGAALLQEARRQAANEAEVAARFTSARTRLDPEDRAAIITLYLCAFAALYVGAHLLAWFLR